MHYGIGHMVPLLGRSPPGQTTPPGQTPPWADTPRQTPPWADTPWIQESYNLTAETHF